MIDKSLIREDYSFTMFDKNGFKVICDTLALIDSVDNPIIVYTDYTMNNNNKFNLYVSQIVASEEGFSLETINDYSDIPEIQSTLDTIWKR